MTLPTRAELLGSDILRFMEAMTEAYGKRMGIEGAMIAKHHRAMAEELFSKTA
jgi:hypothetical protein